MAGKKRDQRYIDLTGDNSPPRKRQASSSNTASQRSTPAGSSQLSASRNGSQTHFSEASVDDSEVLILTQEPDGPEKELYGTLSKRKPRDLILTVSKRLIILQPTKSLAFAITMASSLQARWRCAIASPKTRLVTEFPHELVKASDASYSTIQMPFEWTTWLATR
jgi:hypothetical protein